MTRRQKSILKIGSCFQRHCMILKIHNLNSLFVKTIKPGKKLQPLLQIVKRLHFNHTYGETHKEQLFVF